MLVRRRVADRLLFNGRIDRWRIRFRCVAVSEKDVTAHVAVVGIRDEEVDEVAGPLNRRVVFLPAAICPLSEFGRRHGKVVAKKSKDTGLVHHGIGE